MLACGLEVLVVAIQQCFEASGEGFDPRTAPPYIIRKEHVDRICTELELRNQIKYRFDLTLDLDPRYRIIAHTIAFESMTTQPETLVNGLDWQEIRTLTLSFSHGEFKDCESEDRFRVLLDEMVGLGVLRRVNESRYSLRSPNVLSFMGTEDDILDGLASVHTERELKYDAATFRAALPASNCREGIAQIRSPLTAEQTSALSARCNGVSVLFGSKALGLDHVLDFLEPVFDSQFIVRCTASTDADFRNYIDELRYRSKENLTLALITPNLPWTVSWIESAMTRVARFRSERGHVRVVFVADPAKTWLWFGQKTGRLKQIIEHGGTTFNLQLWHDAALKQRMADCGFPVQLSDQVHEVTRLWPTLIEKLFETYAQSGDPEAAIKSIEESLHSPHGAGALLTEMGVNLAPGASAILDLIGLNPTSADDIHDLFADDPAFAPPVVQRVLSCAEALNLARSEIRPAGLGNWLLNPLVAELMKTAGAAVNA